ncbi:neutral zinc metallopeptidase [Nonomuraea guangzhouensis]|uniref:Neutral zinc metallopeptidase n=1 Tax=Nonomuraea guangzhouensis TaxID=1291555 RepID=A0ABW4GLV2_9ACTN|nr:neutral zinc metallopeptidase [Nonomuraea guangzhouensis]
MRKLLIMTLTAASMLSLSATATAATTATPVKHPKLIANPLYEAGALPATTCEEPKVKRNDRKSGRAYVDAVIACLESTWEQHLTAADLPFSKVKVRYVSKLPKTYCGTRETEKEDSTARYCGKTGELVFQLGKTWLDDPSDLWLFNTVSYMYGWHVMKLVGIADAYDAAPSSGKTEDRELARRQSLQNDCFSTAFLKSVWPLKGRTTKDWTYLLSMVEGDAPGEARLYGKRANVVAWYKRGFATGDPGSCNTWTAPSSKVA